MDGAWIHHYTPESNRQSAAWTLKGGNRLNRRKTQISAGKFLDSVFWDSHGILFIDYLEKGGSINNEYHMVLLVRLKQTIAKNRPHIEKRKVLFHQDNAPCHK